jgi:hypothetical protein
MSWRSSLTVVGRGSDPLRSVRRLPWDDSTNTTARLIDISRPTRDQMHMAVHDRLSRGLSAVHAHVEAFDRFVLSEHLQSHLIQKQIDRAPLWVMEVEIGDSVTARDDQGVQWCDRVGIVERGGQFVLRDDRTVARATKEALH